MTYAEYTYLNKVPQGNNDNNWDKIFPNPYFVYVICKSSFDEGFLLPGPVKVGISSNPKKRLDGIRTSCPFHIEIAFSFCFPGRELAEIIEREFHLIQDSVRLHGEWFDLDPLEAIYHLCGVARAAIGQDAALLEYSQVIWCERKLLPLIKGQA